ncbi:MAG: glycosyltransferase family 4 protein [Bacteroidota bacterium]
MALHRKALRLAHRHVWQRLPPSLRRAALIRTTSLLAPRPQQEIAPTQPIFVAGVLRTASGLGQSARLSYEALSQLGFDTFGVDLTGGLMQPDDLADYRYRDGRLHAGPGTVLLHVNGPLVPLALMHLRRDFVRGKHIIGYWAWELDQVPDEWRAGVPFVHEVWVPSQFTATAVSRIADGKAVRTAPHPVAVRPHAAAVRQAAPFRVLVIFNCASGFERKNPCAAIAAFRQAFGADPTSELLIRASHLDSHPSARRQLEAAIGGQDNIHLIHGVAPAADIDKQYEAADVLLSLHRAEGFGLVPAEAMLRGLPVVGTNWSGNVDFMNESNSCPVRYTLVPARDPQRVYDYPRWTWAEPDIAHAAHLLRRLRDDTGYRARIGEQAAKDAAELFSPRAYGAHMRALLEQTPVATPAASH